MDIATGFKRVRQAVASISLATMLVSMLLTGVAQAAVANYNDVPAGAWYYTPVMTLANAAIVDGPSATNNYNYNPSGVVNRAQMTKFAVLAAKLTLVNPATPSFKDEDKAAWYYPYVETAAAHGIVSGYKDVSGNLTGKFGPGDAVTREQAAKILVNAFSLTTFTPANASFPDVNPTMWSYSFVETARHWSVLKGNPDGTFKPFNNINRAELAQMVVGAMNPVAAGVTGAVTGAASTSATTVDVMFNKAVDPTTGAVAANYTVKDSNGNALAVSAATVSGSKVSLATAAQTAAMNYTVTVAGVVGTDAAKTSLAGTAPFVGFGTVVPAGAATFAVASDTPAAAIHASGTAYNPALKFNVTASASGDVTLTSLTVTRGGLSIDSNISGIALFDSNGVRYGNFVTFATGKATISFPGTPIVVKAGTTSAFMLKTNLTSGALSGSYNVAIASSSDVGTTSTISGNFPIVGNTFSLTDGSSVVGSLTVDAVQVFSNGVNDGTAVNVNLGTKDQDVSKFRFTAGANEDVKINKITLYNNGNSNDGDVQNIRLIGPDGTTLATVNQSVNRYVVFDLTANPYLITKGNSRDLGVRVDVVNGSTRTVRFLINNDYDVEAVGASTNSGLLETAAGTNDTAFPMGDATGGSPSCAAGVTCINKITINSGTVLFAKASDAPSGNIAAGAQGQILGKWDITAQGEDMELRQMNYTLNYGTVPTGSLKIQVDGNTVYTTSTMPTSGVATGITLNTYPVIKSNVKSAITFIIDVGSNTASGQTYSVSLDVTQVKRLSTTDLVDPGVNNTPCNTLTVATAALSVSKNASYSDSTIVAGSNQAEIGSFNLTASSTEDVVVSSVTIGLTNTTNIANLYMMDSATNTQVGSTVTSPSSSNAISVSGYKVLKGTTNTLNVYVTTNGSTTGTEVASISALSASGASSSVTVTATGLTTTGQTITFSAGGTLTVALDTTNTPVSQILHSGQLDAPLLAASLTTNNAENIKVTTVQVTARSGATSLRDLKLFFNGAQVGTTTQLNNGVASFNDPNGLFTLTKDSSSTVYVKGSTTSSGTLDSQAVSDLSFDYMEGIGSSSGSKIKPGTTLSTTWSASNITTAGGAITVANTSGFHIGDVVFAYDGTNGGTIGMVTAEPTSTTSMSVSGRAAVTYAGGASILKLESGATTAASAGTPTKAGVAITVTSTKAFTVGDAVLVQGGTAPQLGFVSAIGSSTSMTVNTITTGGIGVASRVSKIGSDTLSTVITATTALTTSAVATSVTSTSGFNVGDLILVQDTTANGSFGVVTAVGSSTGITLMLNGAVTPTSATSATLVRIGAANPSTTLVSTAASAGTRAIAATATTVTSSSGFGANDVVVTTGTGGAEFGFVSAVASATSMSVNSASAIGGAATRVSRLPGAASAGNALTFEDVEPTISVTPGFTGGAAVGGTTQVVGKFDVKADGDRTLNFTALALDASGSNAPGVNVTTYKLYNGGTLLSQATSVVSAVTGAGAQTLNTGTTFKLCKNTPAAANEIGLGSASNVTASAALITVGDTIDIVSSAGNYITANVTAKSVTGDCTAADAADVTLTVASKTITGTAPTSSTATTIGNRTVRFNSTATVPLATQSITAGSTLTLSVQADTSNVKNGLSGNVGANYSVTINGTQGSTGELTWGYTPSGAAAITSLTSSDSYPVSGPTFTY